jgi:hypothetical protein
MTDLAFAHFAQLECATARCETERPMLHELRGDAAAHTSRSSSDTSIDAGVGLLASLDAFLISLGRIVSCLIPELLASDCDEVRRVRAESLRELLNLTDVIGDDVASLIIAWWSADELVARHAGARRDGPLIVAATSHSHVLMAHQAAVAYDVFGHHLHFVQIDGSRGIVACESLRASLEGISAAASRAEIRLASESESTSWE